MNNKLLFLLSFIITLNAYSQSLINQCSNYENKDSKKSLLIDIRKSTPFWSEDFSDGIPSSWTNSNVPWVYRGINTVPNNNVGSQGAYSGINNTPPTNDPISSNSVSNGFIIFDSDYYDNNGVVGAFGTGAHPTPHNGELMTEMIDMSAYTDVSLTFHSYYRTFAGQAFVDFYVAGVFTERVQVHSNITVNNSTSIDNIAYVRVPFSVVGNADVQLSFVFEGTTNIVNTFSGYYFWQIDDLELSETPENFIEIEDVVIGGYWLDYTNYTGTGANEIIGLDYTHTPLSQLDNHPFVIEGVIRNLGYADQPLSMIKYDVTGSNVYSGSSSPTLVQAFSSTNTIDSVILGADQLSPSLGVYDLKIWGESDLTSVGGSYLTTDTVKKSIEVTEHIYGKDLGSSTPSSLIIGGPTDEWHFTTRYEMYANEQLYSIRVYLTGETIPGAIIKAVIYEIDTTATNNLAIYSQSDFYTVTPQDTGNWIDIPVVDFNGNPIQLFNGYAYSVGISGFQSPVDSAFVGTSGNSMYNGEHMRFDVYGLNPTPNGTAGTPTWYYTTRTPMIRMNFDPNSIPQPSTINDLESQISIYSNLDNDILMIKLNILKEYEINIFNVLGQVVYQSKTNSLNNELDVSFFDQGLYTVELTVDDFRYSKVFIK